MLYGKSQIAMMLLYFIRGQSGFKTKQLFPVFFPDHLHSGFKVKHPCVKLQGTVVKNLHEMFFYDLNKHLRFPGTLLAVRRQSHKLILS